MPARTLRARPAALQGLEEALMSSGRAVSDQVLTKKTLSKLRRFLQATQLSRSQQIGGNQWFRGLNKDLEWST